MGYFHNLVVSVASLEVRHYTPFGCAFLYQLRQPNLASYFHFESF